MELSQSVIRRVLVVWGVLHILALPNRAAAQSLDDQYRLLRQNLITSFSAQKLVPIITSRGEKVGDAYDISDLTLLSRASDCFPNLGEPKAVPTSLPNVVNLGELDVSLAVGAPELGQARGALAGARAIEIHYIDPKVQVVSVKELQNAFRARACRDLEPIVTGKYVQQLDAHWPLVVAEVYSAKREVVISSGDKTSGEVSVSGLTALLRKLKLEISASASADYQKSKRISLQSTISVPVAVRPAFLPRKFVGVNMGGDAAEATSPTPGAQWTIFEPTVQPSQNALFDQLMAGAACTSIGCFNRPK